MYIFLPDIYVKSIYAIDYESLKNSGIKIILFDLDNTIVPINANEPPKKLKELFDDIKEMGIKPVIMSNSGKKRVKPFKDGLIVDAACSSLKPLSRKYKKIMELYSVKASEIAAVGDQLLTDMLGANRLGITTILVNPISTNDFKITTFNRFIENIIINHFTKKGVFKKGEYYE